MNLKDGKIVLKSQWKYHIDLPLLVELCGLRMKNEGS